MINAEDLNFLRVLKQRDLNFFLRLMILSSPDISFIFPPADPSAGSDQLNIIVHHSVVLVPSQEITMPFQTVSSALLLALCCWSACLVSSFTPPKTHHLLRRISLYEASNSADVTIGTVAILVPKSAHEPSLFGYKSPVSRPSYQLAAEQLARKIRQFSDGKVSTKVVTPGDNDDACLASNALIALGLSSPSDIQYLSRTFRQRREEQQQQQAGNTCQFAVHCAGNTYAPMVGPYDEANPSVLATVSPWTGIASGQRLATQMTELFDKSTSDEFALAVMLFFNQFSGTKIPWVQHSIDVTWEKGLLQNAKEIYAMITKCGPCITKCLNDEDCSSCIKGKAC